MKRKVLWFSGFKFSDFASACSGTWVEAMGRALSSRADYELYNITVDGNRDGKICRCDVPGIRQWTVPWRTFDKVGMPPKRLVSEICAIVDEINPGLIHNWGSERYWGELTARKVIDRPTLLEMQGIKWAIEPYMLGGLTFGEQLKCISFKEMIRFRSSIWGVHKHFLEFGRREKGIVSGHRFIDYQSEWTRENIEPYVHGATLFKTKRMLRTPFLNCAPWKFVPNRHIVFSSVWLAPNKGMHVLLRAISELKHDYPDVKLLSTGQLKPWYKRDGYVRWLLREIKRLGIVENVEFLDPVPANRLIELMQNASVMVNPSLVESYSLTLAEAQAVGIPSVVSYAGAMPEVGGDAALYFPILDAGVCAAKIRELFESRETAETLSQKGRARSLERHKFADVLDRQLAIYDEIFKLISEN